MQIYDSYEKTVSRIDIVRTVGGVVTNHSTTLVHRKRKSGALSSCIAWTAAHWFRIWDLANKSEAISAYAQSVPALVFTAGNLA